MSNHHWIYILKEVSVRQFALRFNHWKVILKDWCSNIHNASASIVERTPARNSMARNTPAQSIVLTNNFLEEIQAFIHVRMRRPVVIKMSSLAYCNMVTLRMSK